MLFTVEKRVEVLAKNENGHAILGEDDEPTEVSVHIAGAVHEEDNGQPQGSIDEVAHGYITADEAEYNDGQSQIPTDNENESHIRWY